MNGSEHRIVGITTVAAVGILTWPSVEIAGATIYPLLGLLLADAGSKYADIDMSNTEKGRKFPWMGKIFTHRGITHTRLATLVVMLPVFMVYAMMGQGSIVTDILLSVLYGFPLAYLSHIIIDSFNGKGTPLYFPISRSNVHVMNISTGTGEDIAFTGVLVFMIIAHVICVLTGVTIT